MPDENVIITVSITDPALHTVTFDANGGTIGMGTETAATRTTDKDGKLASIPTAAYDGRRVFEGWYTEATGGTKQTITTSTVFSADTTVYAHWTETPVAITFMPNYGSLAGTAHNTGANGKIATLPTISRTGYNFDGWYTAATGGDAITVNTVFNDATSVYAHWTEITAGSIIVTFNPNGGTVSPASEVAGSSGTLANLPTPTWDGRRVFAGWYPSISPSIALRYLRTACLLAVLSSVTSRHFFSVPPREFPWLLKCGRIGTAVACQVIRLVSNRH